MHPRRLTVAAALAVALSLTACGNGPGSDTASGAGPGSGSSSQEAANDADVSFLTGMTPHHEQAVEMSDLVLAAGPPAEVADLARRIKAAQDPEITEMEGMLADLGKDGDAGSHGSGHGAGHGDAHSGMLSEQDLATLEQADGVAAARLYLKGMIAHHRGAIEAAQTELEDGTYAPARALAERIAEQQAAEITTMERLLQQL